MAEENKPNDTKQGVTRREFLKNSGYAVGGVIGGSLLGGLFVNQFGTGGTTETTVEEAPETTETPDFTEARMFFKRQEDFQVLSAAVERIFPEDDLGPGAIALGAPYYIDKQLAGEYGFNAREYMQGPFFEGAPTQGYQSALLRRDAFLQGVRRIQNVSQDNFNEAFFDLSDEQQDEIIEAFSEGEVEMDGIGSDTFFEMLRGATLEGVYADPVYGGNRNMDGWRMKQYPGGQMAYLNMYQEDEFIEMEPISLRDHHS